MHRSDGTRTPPGRETLAEVIGTAPTVVMIHESAAYLRTCSQSGDEDVRRMARQIPAFLKTLSEHAMSTPNLVVVIAAHRRRQPARSTLREAAVALTPLDGVEPLKRAAALAPAPARALRAANPSSAGNPRPTRAMATAGTPLGRPVSRRRR